jgi:hypothetical protein
MRHLNRIRSRVGPEFADTLRTWGFRQFRLIQTQCTSRYLCSTSDPVNPWRADWDAASGHKRCQRRLQMNGQVEGVRDAGAMELSTGRIGSAGEPLNIHRGRWMRIDTGAAMFCADLRPELHAIRPVCLTRCRQGRTFKFADIVSEQFGMLTVLLRTPGGIALLSIYVVPQNVSRRFGVADELVSTSGWTQPIVMAMTILVATGFQWAARVNAIYKNSAVPFASPFSTSRCCEGV